MQFEEQYPNKPPSVKFVSQMFHPNVYNTGELCLDILQNRWSPTYDVAAILTSIQRCVCCVLFPIVGAGPVWLTVCPVSSTIQIHRHPPMSRHPTCTRTTAVNTPSGCVRRLRKAGRTRIPGLALMRHDDDNILHYTWTFFFLFLLFFIYLIRVEFKFATLHTDCFLDQ